ncbi:putative Mitochondrial transcription termination factor family protein [Melia azedarach]|uniref:Mitochondrial transcription termination factor family protein n=2 Tax=Melia azedarach TaxID=155640 RepID=A0ACC1WW93_MELAZ|nr:putative Mitochondrial transcription termination factor family protein [Melia azedarach]
MVLPRIHKRVFSLSRMVTQLNHFLVFCPVFNEKPSIMQNPCFISVKVRSFCSARLTHQPKVSLPDSTPSSTLIASRVSRHARTEAQDVLFDYLHSTRTLSYLDAEHISKNSPHFVQNLLSKIDSDKDVTRSLSRFLRYNPINEFEPFFESLGLSPSEISSFLPRHLIFLSDDEVMLDNFRVLCDYGIPRSKMGNMYKEVTEIFGYDYGVLDSKLRAYENLGLSKNTVIKLVNCCPLLLIGGVDGKFVKVLQKLKELGFKNDWIGGYLSGKGTYNWNRVFETIDFLDNVGYSEEQLCNLFKMNPALVFEGSGRKVYVLFGQLLKLGLKMNEVYSLFTENPQLLSAKCVKNLLKAVGFLVDIGMGIKDIANIVSKHAEHMGSCSLKGPKTVCRELKVGRDGLCQIIKDKPLQLFHLVSKTKVKINEQVDRQNPSKHLEKTTFLLSLGYVENSEEMTKALKQFRGRGDQLQERFDCLVQAGLDSNVVKNLIKRAPMVLNQTKDVLEKKIDCLKNYLGYPLQSVVVFPAYLCYDLERINHRCKMYVWLRERRAAKPTLSLSTILACSDARFVKYFVDVHPEGPAMWESLKKSSNLS